MSRYYPPCALAPARQNGSGIRLRGRLVLAWICLAAISLPAGSLAQQAEREMTASAAAQNHARIQRLRDRTPVVNDWSVAIPEHNMLLPDSDTGNAGYSVLQQDLHEIERMLARNPQDEQALNRLQITRERIHNRILTNLESGYLYAAGLYIDLLIRANPADPDIPVYQQHVREWRRFRDHSARFDMALEDQRLQYPESDCARYYLQQMRSLVHIDPARVLEAEQQLHYAQLALLDR